ncbi:hypothetical protein JL09_g6760, partial [Pichia kudriavzevii]
MSEESD